MHRFFIRFWIFPPKIVKIQQFSIFFSGFKQNHDFWRENLNYSGNFLLFLHLKILKNNGFLAQKSKFWIQLSFWNIIFWRIFIFFKTCLGILYLLSKIFFFQHRAFFMNTITMTHPHVQLPIVSLYQELPQTWLVKQYVRWYQLVIILYMEPPIRNVGQRLPIQEEEQMLVGHRAPKHAPATRTHKQM